MHATPFTLRLVNLFPLPFFDVPFYLCTFALLPYRRVMTVYQIFKVYDAINENPEAPNIDFPDDADEQKAIIDFNACKKFY